MKILERREEAKLQLVGIATEQMQRDREGGWGGLLQASESNANQSENPCKSASREVPASASRAQNRRRPQCEAREAGARWNGAASSRPLRARTSRQRAQIRTTRPPRQLRKSAIPNNGMASLGRLRGKLSLMHLAATRLRPSTRLTQYHFVTAGLIDY